jgi:hypothetical protein
VNIAAPPRGDPLNVNMVPIRPIHSRANRLMVKAVFDARWAATSRSCDVHGDDGRADGRRRAGRQCVSRNLVSVWESLRGSHGYANGSAWPSSNVRFTPSYVRLSPRSRHSRYGPRLPLMTLSVHRSERAN